ncbi:hypothetical protein [Candidatus Thiodictyon syntrophicum]|jgi:hypothetical protein|uniref:DUF1640 domain-containing protein n=1 Tax=Candidatus Thiodictyon syntrophicum TaxID=1166950 RepID=A0A2K8U643_9GAMM|nr:hypothetical protein [Candidatus Thiodictyon syntrophicum]AUB80869.1 hypothetical protein THSYN_07830 [Candidatus Thiodictyon syntrophicum]
MTAIPFDTHKFIRTIKDSGIPENQAEAIAEAFKAAQCEADPATKAEVAQHENHLQHSIEVLRLELKRDIAESKAELTRWVIGAGILQTSIIIGVLLKVARLV